jgi:hypothetical protein
MKTKTSSIIVHTLIAVAIAVSFVGLEFGRYSLRWAYGGPGDLYPIGWFLLNQLHTIEIVTGVISCGCFFRFKRHSLIVAVAWLQLNILLWLFCITFSILEQSSKNTQIQINGTPSGRLDKE